MKKGALILGMTLILAAFPAAESMLSPCRPAYALDWKAEFDDICVKTNEAQSLSREDLKGLIERCDRLKPLIEALEETQKKVYLKRLKMCRDLLAFALESREEK